MIGQVNTVDGNKTVLPLAGSIPVGNPVGSFLYTYKKLRPRNYLYCDGSTFNAGQYPALYLYLGTNVLPDYRECAMVGAEQNTTDVIATHDVYSQGEFKDDQIQNITGSFKDNSFITATGYANDVSGAIYNSNVTNGGHSGGGGSSNSFATRELDASRVARAGTTTHGKQKAVYVYIKAVDGVDISDEDTFLDTVKNFVEEKNSYSTTEMLTGGTWIDGKPIYRKVYDNGSWATSLDFDASSLNIEILIKTDVIGSDSSGGNGNRWLINSVVDNGIIFLQVSNQHIIVRNTNTYKRYAIIEYTKTTD